MQDEEATPFLIAYNAILLKIEKLNLNKYMKDEDFKANHLHS